MTLIKHCFEGAAGLMAGDLDEEDFHLAELSVAHFVSALRQTQIPASAKREGERPPDMRRLVRPPRFRLREFHRQGAVGKDDLEILAEAGSELFAGNGGEVEHSEK